MILPQVQILFGQLIHVGLVGHGGVLRLSHPVGKDIIRVG